MRIDGTLIEAKRCNIASKPVESVKSVKEATQNQTRRENIKNFVNPSSVIVNVNKPKSALKTGLPYVRNKIGNEITAAKSGIKRVLAINPFNGILETTAKTTGMMHNNSK
jgi:hypothetical protein